MASELKSNRLAQSHIGSAPSIAVADINENDVDFYEIKTPMGYAGSITVELQTSGISLLDPVLSIFDGELSACRTSF